MTTATLTISERYELRLLKQEARESATWRNHEIGRFGMIRAGRAIASCKRCDMAVMVILRPMPNEIDICGDAIALNCEQVSA